MDGASVLKQWLAHSWRTMLSKGCIPINGSGGIDEAASTGKARVASTGVQA
jgi:hypothetical protein